MDEALEKSGGLIMGEVTSCMVGKTTENASRTSESRFFCSRVFPSSNLFRVERVRAGDQREAKPISPDLVTVRFLLETQEDDGSWHVARRPFPFQPTMKSGFPHHRDSWISAAATSWGGPGIDTGRRRSGPHRTSPTIAQQTLPARTPKNEQKIDLRTPDQAALGTFVCRLSQRRKAAWPFPHCCA